MTRRHLIIFIAVYQAENITRAAERLHMTQPNVTRAIHELEDFYGTRLFERMNRGISATQAGKRLYAYAINIVESFERMDAELRDWDALGVLRIGCSPKLGGDALPRIVLRLGERYPHLEIKMQVNNGTFLQEALLNNQLDFALLEGARAEPNLVRELFSQDTMVPVLPPDDPRKDSGGVPLRALAEDRMLMRETGSVARTFIEHVFETHELALDPAMESVSTHAIVQAVHAGLGISILPEPLVRASIESGFVATCRITDESLLRKNYIVWHKNKLFTRAARDFIDICHAIGEMSAE